VSGVWRKELAFSRLCAGFQRELEAERTAPRGWEARVRPEVCTGITRVRRGAQSTGHRGTDLYGDQ
jgi:hypothetical protein